MPQSIQALLSDIQLLGETQFALIQALRELVHQQVPEAQAQVKYGGILFSCDVPFCGLFAYQAHVSVEFSQGAAINDPWGFLEGTGKARRHIKLSTLADIDAKHLASYVVLAHQAATA